MVSRLKQFWTVAFGSLASAVGFGGSAAIPAAVAAGLDPLLMGAAGVVCQIVAGIAVNYTSDKLTPLLDGESAADPEVNDDLERVAKWTLLSILLQVLEEQGVKNATGYLEEAGKAWDLRIFPADPSPDELVELLREPIDLDDAQAREIARQILPLAVQGHLDAYAAAVAKRFAHTYAVLLRSDERAHRAAVIYLQQLGLRDLADIRRDLEWLTKPQPVLDRYEGLRKAKGAAAALEDLQFKRRATQYRPRIALQKQIREWLLAEERFGVLKLTGAAGMGKSRLAMELVDWCHGQHWLAGFVPQNGWVVGDGWRPVRDTLIVVDYAGFKTLGGRSAFEWLKRVFLDVNQAAPAGRARVRVMLLDRSDQGRLWSDWRGSEEAIDLDRHTLAVDLQPDRDEFRELASDEIRRRLGREASLEQRAAIDAVAERLRGQFRPLFALLAGGALAEGKSAASEWSPEELVESVLKAQARQWGVAGVTDEQLDLLFEATLTQGLCNADTDFVRRLDALAQDELDALSTLSDPGRRLGGIVPDLLGEFFVLARLRGELTRTERRQVRRTVEISRGILARSWGNPAAEEFAGRLLEDYLGWTSARGEENPAEVVMEGALRQIEQGGVSWGLLTCAFVAAWRRPEARDWAAWLVQDVLGGNRRTFFVEGLAVGLQNAAAGAPDPRQRAALAQRIEKLHNECGAEPAAREQLAKALFSATVREVDAQRCLVLAERIDKLHRNYGAEPAVREQLAKALFKATAVETDAGKRLALANRIDKLHNDYGAEPTVRQLLAGALLNVTFVETDAGRRAALAGRIEKLHNQWGAESRIRDRLAKALYNSARVETDEGRWTALVERIERLHTDYGAEPGVRESLAKALCSATVREEDAAGCLALANRIEKLHNDYRAEPAVREQLVNALYNATVREPHAARRVALAERIDRLHDAYGAEPVVRAQLAGALRNATAREEDAVRCLALADRIEKLHNYYGAEPAVREHLAEALGNATINEGDPLRRMSLIDQIEKLHNDHGAEPGVRAALVHALAAAVLPACFQAPGSEAPILERLQRLAGKYAGEPVFAEIQAKLSAIHATLQAALERTRASGSGDGHPQT